MTSLVFSRFRGLGRGLMLLCILVFLVFFLWFRFRQPANGRSHESESQSPFNSRSSLHQMMSGWMTEPLRSFNL